MIRRHFDSWLKQKLWVRTVHRVDKYSFCAIKEQLNASCNHQQPSAIIYKIQRWFVPYHVVIPRDSVAREVPGVLGAC